MIKRSQKSVFIISLLLLTTIFGFYYINNKDRFYNIITQSTEIDLNRKNSVYLIEKHPEQNAIYRLEIGFKGKLSDNITVYLSEDGINGLKSIRIKNGKVNTTFMTDWSLEKAYLIIENPNNSTNKMEVEYQFVSK